MPAPTWFALAFFVVAILVPAVHAFRRGRNAWRALSAFTGTTGAAATALGERAAALEPRAAAVGAGAERLEAAQRRLRGSTAELALLREAAGEAGGLLRAARASVPRK